jgi:hypothetical protein
MRKGKWFWSICAVAFLLTVVPSVVSAQDGASTATILVPRDIPTPKIATKLTAVSKILEGQEVRVLDQIRHCPLPGNEQTRFTRWTVRALIQPWQCDEPCSNPALNGTFIATITVERREKPLFKRGCFTGTWRIINAFGVTVASGTMSGTVRAGTHDIVFGHDDKCEDCAQPYHFEGCLEGNVRAPARPGTNLPKCIGRLCATFQGVGLDPDLPVLNNTGATIFLMRLEGALKGPCKQ